MYAEVVQILETPDTFLIIEGVLDLRAGQLQLRADNLKHTKLSRVIENAKKSGFYDEEAAKSGIAVVVKPQIEEEEIEIVDEEGNVIAGETVTLQSEGETDDFVGPLGRWIVDGAQIEEVLKEVNFLEIETQRPSEGEESNTDDAKEEEPSVTKINIYTIELPARAPKKMLLELKAVLETFSGKEKVQLKIGEQIVPLPLTINPSTVLEQKIEELLQRYESPVA
jgi:hypothetical protein